MKCEIERNAEISMMRKEGATFREIAEWYHVSVCRAQQIANEYADGNTKEEIIRNYKRKQERRQSAGIQPGRRKNQEIKDYAIRNGAADVFLTEIKGTGGDTVYIYGSKDIRDALMFTEKEARRIAKERRAVACWVILPYRELRNYEG